MLKKITIVILIVTGSNSLFARNLLSETNNSSFKPEIKLSFIIPGVIVEQRINKKIAAVFSVIEGFSFTYVTKGGESFSDLKLYTYLSIEPRYKTVFTTNLTGRYTKINGYFGIPIIYGFNESSMTTGIVYGFQRSIGKRGFFNISLGYGITKYSGKIIGLPIGGLNLGIKLI